MNFRKAIGGGFAVLLAVAGGSVYWSIENETAGTVVRVPQSEVDAFRIHTGLLRASDAKAREAAALAFAATGVNPAPPFERAAWCVPLEFAGDAGDWMASALCFADRTCRDVTCAAVDVESQADCVASCARDAACLARESAALDAQPQLSTTEGGPATHVCAEWPMTPALRARFESGRPDVGTYAFGDGASATASAGLYPVEVEP